MITDALAAVSQASENFSMADVREIREWLTLILLPLAAMLWRMDRRLAVLLTWKVAHEKLDDERFRAFERRQNVTDSIMNSVLENYPIAVAVVKPLKGNQ